MYLYLQFLQNFSETLFIVQSDSLKDMRLVLAAKDIDQTPKRNRIIGKYSSLDVYVIYLNGRPKTSLHVAGFNGE